MTNGKSLFNKQYKVVEDLDEIKNEFQGGTFSQTIMETDTFKVVLFNFDQGEALSEHTTPMEANIQVLKGEIQMTLDQDLISAKSGTYIYMSKNLPHSLKAVEQTSMLLTLIK